MASEVTLDEIANQISGILLRLQRIEDTALCEHRLKPWLDGLRKDMETNLQEAVSNIKSVITADMETFGAVIDRKIAEISDQLDHLIEKTISDMQKRLKTMRRQLNPLISP